LSEKTTEPIELPRYLDKSSAADFFTRFVSASSGPRVMLRWGECAWLEPSELLKLAVLLDDLGA
jgi:hypothetical protein